MSVPTLIKRRFFRRKHLANRRIGNHQMLIDVNDRGIGRTLLNMKPNSPDREIAFMKVLRKELEPGMTALEIGANIGYATLIMAEIVGSKGKIYAFEPDPSNFKLLSRNIAINNYENVVSGYQMGISNANTSARFHKSKRSNLHSMTPTVHSSSTIDIDLIPVDEFMKDKRQPNFIKMDIEGHEVEALEGMFHTLKAAKPPLKILMEVHPQFYSEEHSLEKQLKRLIQNAFNTKYVISAGVGQPKWFAERGYNPVEVLDDGDWFRGIYTDVSNNDMLLSACHEHEHFIEHKGVLGKKIVRAVMLEKL